MEKRIVFTGHAEYKMLLLQHHGFKIGKRTIEELLGSPLKTRGGYAGRKVAEGELTKEHILRVVFEESPKEIRIVILNKATNCDVWSSAGRALGRTSPRQPRGDFDALLSITPRIHKC